MYTEGAVIVGITAVNLPFMVLTLSSVIEGIDPALEEAAFNLGARPLQVFRRVILPLAMPGVLAGTILVFILGMNAYATPILLGGPRFQMMGPVVYGQFAGQNNWPFGAALSFVLMAATLGAERRVARPRPAPLPPLTRRPPTRQRRTRRGGGASSDSGLWGVVSQTETRPSVEGG